MGQSINRQIKRLEKHPGEFQKFNEFISSYSGEDLTDLGYDVEIQKDDFSIDDDKKYLFWFWQNRKKIFVDRTVLQRLLSVWDDERANSNLSHYLAGSTGKDLIQLALIKPIVEGLLVQINLADEEEEKDILEALKENYEHFKEILEDGYEYLLLDGQHRLDRVNAYFNNELHFSWTNGWSDTSIKVKGHRLKLTGRWNDLDDLAKIYVSTIRIPTTIYSSSNIKLLKMIMSDSNHNQPMSHHERRSIVSNSVAGRFLTNLFYDVKFEKSGLLSPEWVEFWDRIKGMTSDYQLSKKGPTLLATHLLNYMINSKGSTGGYRWTDAEDDDLYADSCPVSKVDRKKFTRYMMIITRAILSRPKSPKVSRGSLIDLFLFLHGIENVFHGRKYSISRNVEKQIELVDKFIEQQTENIPSITNYFVLFADLNNDKINKKLIKNLKKHNSKEKYFFSSIKPNHKSFEEKRYWRGPVWINCNWFIYKGLKNKDKFFSDKIKNKTIQILEKKGFFEYFSCKNGEPMGAKNFSWSAALYLDMMLNKN